MMARAAAWPGPADQGRVRAGRGGDAPNRLEPHPGARGATAPYQPRLSFTRPVKEQRQMHPFEPIASLAKAAATPHSSTRMSDRQLILEAVQEMPDQASFPEILDELLLLGTVKQRLARVENGEAAGQSSEQVAELLRQWITK